MIRASSNAEAILDRASYFYYRPQHKFTPQLEKNGSSILINCILVTEMSLYISLVLRQFMNGGVREFVVEILPYACAGTYRQNSLGNLKMRYAKVVFSTR
jgi:hypothetical protein